MKYGLISSNRGNIGDDIQSLAAENFLPRIDLEIDQDNINQINLDEKLKVICNGWWAKSKNSWPPPSNLIPLMIGCHITANLKGQFIKSKNLYKSSFGARDQYTLDFLKLANIDSYLSYCLTLTFEKYDGPRNGIVCVDVQPELASHLGVTDFFSHYRPEVFCLMSAFERRNYAKKLLDVYKKASLVLTTRLHCILPCLAFGTPAVLVPTNYSMERFLGYEKLINFISLDQLRLLNPRNIKVPNIDEIRNKLKLKCAEFVD